MLGNSKDCRGTHMHKAPNTRGRGFLRSDATAFDIHFPKPISRFGEWNQCSVMVDDLDLLQRPTNGASIADITLKIFDLRRARFILPKIEHSDPFALADETAGDQVAKESGASCD